MRQQQRPSLVTSRKESGGNISASLTTVVSLSPVRYDSLSVHMGMSCPINRLQDKPFMRVARWHKITSPSKVCANIVEFIRTLLLLLEQILYDVLVNQSHSLRHMLDYESKLTQQRELDVVAVPFLTLLHLHSFHPYWCMQSVVGLAKNRLRLVHRTRWNCKQDGHDGTAPHERER